jgi:Fic family protein
LRREDFDTNAPGELIEHADGLHFVPAPLPPRIAFSAPFVKLLTEAERALGELKAFSAIAPNVQLLMLPFIKREAVLSSKIEGTVTRLDQLLLFEVDAESQAGNEADAREVMNYVTATFHGMQLLETIPLCLRVLREVHARLMEGVRGAEKRPGEFRTIDVIVGRAGATKAGARFVPPPAQQLEPLLRNLEQFFHADELPVVAQLAIAHYQFEAIHPFLDGNGRVGRLMISLMLVARQLLTKPLLYLSAYFEKHDTEYRDHLLAVSQHNAWEDWIDFVARGIREQAGDVVARTHQLLELQSEYRRRLQDKTYSSNALKLVDAVFSSPYVTINGVAALLNVTFHTAANTVERLRDEGILQELHPERKRNRVFVAPRIVEFLAAEEAPKTKNR